MTSFPSIMAVSEEMLLSRCCEIERLVCCRQIRYVTKQSTPAMETTARAPSPRWRGGSFSRIEQCARASSNPVGQCEIPSHHNDAFMHASNSGQRCSQSRIMCKPSDKVFDDGLQSNVKYQFQTIKSVWVSN